MTDHADGGRRRSSIWRAYTGLLMLPLTFASFACQGDTLYDAPIGGGPDNVAPAPTVAIVRPAPGGQQLAGRRMPVTVTANDTLGISSIQLQYQGAATGSIVLPLGSARESITVDTSITVPAAVSGALELTATARNRLGGIGEADTVRLQVSPIDDSAPFVAFEGMVPDRLERTDTIRFTVRGRDNEGGGGIANLGVSLVGTGPGGAGSLAVTRSTALASPAQRPVETIIAVPVADLGTGNAPAQLRFEVHAFAVDSAGNCSAAVDGAEAQLGCVTRAGLPSNITVADRPAPVVGTMIVAGRSVSLAAGALIADIVPDEQRRRLYLSDHAHSRVRVLDLAGYQFTEAVATGSMPWGLDLNRGGDTLIVANSGGTSISYVTLDGQPAEALERRFRTLNTPLMECRPVGAPADSLGVIVADYSDRPLFLAQDANGVLIYSAVPTSARPAATVRRTVMQQSWQQPESRILFGPDAFAFNMSGTVIAHVDSVRANGSNDRFEFYDHANGFPNQVVGSGFESCASAASALAADPRSDAYVRRETSWNFGSFQYQDTVFIAASGNRGRILIAEGVSSEGRVIAWKADAADVANEITVANLVGNSSENLRDARLNGDGTFAVLRGSHGAYFITLDDLRLQGRFQISTSAQRSGAVLHPAHPSYASLPQSGRTTVAFVDDGDMIRIVDTVHFHERGAIPIRDAVVGPLRVSAPLPADTGTCPGPDCVVARLYAVTDAGAVVVVNVRDRDIH